MATTHHNISGELTQELLAVGDGVKVTSISLTNVHASTTCTVDMYVAKKLTGKFYLLKNMALPVGATLVLEKSDLKLNNNANEFGLFVKLTKGASETPVVDIIIN
tara:strand:- start:527 stop:841 length:315 start_codon:yes stop_codon:yes gene_type:complete